jgi:hypothetical protein
MIKNADVMDRKELSRQCFEKVSDTYRDLFKKVNGRQVVHPSRFYYRRAWSEFNKQAKML